LHQRLVNLGGKRTKEKTAKKKKGHVPAQLNPQRKTTSFKKEKLLKIDIFFAENATQESK